MRGLVLSFATLFALTIQAMAQDLPDVTGKELMVAIRQLEAAGFEVVHDGGERYRGRTNLPFINEDGSTDQDWRMELRMELWRVVLEMEPVPDAEPSAPKIVSLVTEMKEKPYQLHPPPGAGRLPRGVEELKP